MKFQNFYQTSLILCAILITVGVGFFTYQELFPEYKKYQCTYKELEKFRSSYTLQQPPPYSTAIKQILVPGSQNGPEIIDRCISCHVALDLPHFSPTRVALDVNENIMVDQDGNPILEPNPDYIWGKLDQKIAELRHPELIEQLSKQEKKREIRERLELAKKLENFKTAEIAGKKTDMTKVLAMHPLIGSETRPFEFHPMENYGCSSCHSGNGRSLVAERAHGPVYDGDYEKSYSTVKPKFTESDPENDPKFSLMYNDKPGHELIFQTIPILTGPLLAANCVQCHQPTSTDVKSAIEKIQVFTNQKKEKVNEIQEGMKHEMEALASLLSLNKMIYTEGLEETENELNEKIQDYDLSDFEMNAYKSQLTYLKQNEEIESVIFKDILRITGTEESAEWLINQSFEKKDIPLLVQDFFENEKNPSIQTKNDNLESDEMALRQFETALSPFQNISENKKVIEGMHTNVDRLITSYSRGKELFVSQACYACHRIAGFSRASVGPELTRAGFSYPWYIKESIVWPQADLPSSTMPNFQLDHEEVADLMTFLLAQKGESKATAEMDYKISLKEWEAGKKMPWEKPVSPTDIQDISSGMIVFASEGCAACHKLQGYDSHAGFIIEKTDAPVQEIVSERMWFRSLFPEHILGSKLAAIVEEKAEEIDRHVAFNVRKRGILEDLEEHFPGLIEGFYSNFKFAMRAQDTKLKDQPHLLTQYKERLRLVLLNYIQEYGLGRDIAPHLNWSGIYRSNEWLLGHFHNPSGYTARSIMPSMPFDDTKFYMLNHMLHVLGDQNRTRLKEIWKEKGFNAPLAYEILCSQCHGDNRQGNGPVAEWIYPIPKNLRDPIFLRNLTRERAMSSIEHGIHGTPMPPWGEAVLVSGMGKDPEPILNHFEIVQLVSWLYQGIPNLYSLDQKERIEKWQYMPQDVVKEMRNENGFLKPEPPQSEDLEALAAVYFEERPNEHDDVDKELFYIKDVYYTSDNLREAEKFFLVNCATCHGKEGAGTGIRATSMIEAKPRMLTNVPWIRERDDLRLMRSIKYGVPGTSMIPWGDQTTAEQRMQLVMFIRSLSKSQVLRDELESALYKAFDSKIEFVEEARKNEYENLEGSKIRLKTIEELLFTMTEAETTPPSEIATVYTEKIELKRDVEKKSKTDGHFATLITLIKEEKRIFNSTGDQIIAVNVDPFFLNRFFTLMQIEAFEYFLKNGRLQFIYSDKKLSQEKELIDLILSQLNEQIESRLKLIEIEQQKTSDRDRVEKIQKLVEEQKAYTNLKAKLLKQWAHIRELREKQISTYNLIYGKDSHS